MRLVDVLTFTAPNVAALFEVLQKGELLTFADRLQQLPLPPAGVRRRRGRPWRRRDTTPRNVACARVAGGMRACGAGCLRALGARCGDCALST